MESDPPLNLLAVRDVLRGLTYRVGRMVEHPVTEQDDTVTAIEASERCVAVHFLNHNMVSFRNMPMMLYYEKLRVRPCQQTSTDASKPEAKSSRKRSPAGDTATSARTRRASGTRAKRTRKRKPKATPAED